MQKVAVTGIGTAQGYQVTPVEHVHRCPSMEPGAVATRTDSGRHMLGDSRSRRSPHRPGCFQRLITCPAGTLISHVNVSGYSFCLLLLVLLSVLDSRALQSQ